ncbi:hypothetical protein [Methanobrevibacter sp. YE315]|uniref:hypothetical protein n=1 Tax=Methanobrevibacter sp. YE315 TaxID=1609968 RepID=UPI000833FA4A|nr:hypothetical protein [Methanobrevibacter sp. YE315]
MVRCPRCGYDNPSTAVYCNNCAYLLVDHGGKTINNTRRTPRWNMGTARKIVIVLGIIIIALLLFSFIYNFNQPSYDENLNVITDNGTVHKSAAYPYRAVIQYNGSWYAQMGNPSYLVSESGEGSESFVLDCAAWDRICLDVQKQDGGDGELKIQLLRNGQVVDEKSTTNATGNLVINYNY